MKKDKKIYLILHNIRSAQNVGAIFRTADAAGVSKIYLTGYAPAPIDRFGRARRDIAKTALGAEKTIEWEYVKSINSLLKKLKKAMPAAVSADRQGRQGKIKIIAVEQTKNAVDYKKLKVKSEAAFIFGNEVKGLSKSILEKCDTVAQIKMLGKKESLNVSVSAGIFLFRVLNV